MKQNLKILISSAMNKIVQVCLLMWIFGIADHSCMAAESFDDKRPNEHFCPITLQVMREPVVAADGHSYERQAISQYLKTGSLNSPITGVPLQSKDLVANHALKVMIREWKPGKQAEPSVLETRDAESISQRVKEEFRKNAALLNSAQDKHIVAFLGNTGAGKSTLVNLLAGKEIKVSPDGEDYVLAHPDDKAAMVIGTGGNSETIYPKSIDVDGLRFFDLPGFNDTDGSERNLVNAAFTRQILLDAASVRLVFVAGQDQFTADRSASVKQMFNCIRQLFVVGQDISLIDDGVFVATKITCNEKTDLTDFLLKKTDARDKAELHTQLKSWSQRNKLSRMFHPSRDDHNKGIREQILMLIKDTRPAKILGLNVSVLYPADTTRPLERMFSRVIEGIFNGKLKAPLTTLSDYDKAIPFYGSANFWQRFDADVSTEDGAIGLLKEFCINPYNKAFKSFKEGNEKQLQAHVQWLEKKRQERIEDIERRTNLRAKDVISSLVPRAERDDFVVFDFAYHKDFYDQVCGAASIQKLATDLSEQEVVRRYYAGFISEHSHEQMMRWHQKFSGITALALSLQDIQGRLEATEKRLLLWEPLIKAREADLERQRIQETQRAAAEAEQQRRQAAERAVKEEQQKLAIPLVARGYEEIYQRFLKGMLIYRPQKGSDVGRIDLPISALGNPLEGTFDLSGCGDTGKYLSISTGYRKGKKAENANKVEIWFSPRFLIEKGLSTTAKHFQGIFPEWNERAQVGMFWTWGGWDDLGWYDYLTTENMDNLSKIDLYENWKTASVGGCKGARARDGWADVFALVRGLLRLGFSCSFHELK